MSTEEIVPGYNDYGENLFEKMVGPMDDYILCKMELDRLEQRGGDAHIKKDIDDQMMAAKDRIAEILIQQKDLTWVPPIKL